MSFNRLYWTDKEDEFLKKALFISCPMDKIRWDKVASIFNGFLKYSDRARRPAQCRVRWNEHLKFKKNKTKFTKDEDKLMNSWVQKNGNRWVELSKIIDRSPLQLRTRWHNKFGRYTQNINIMAKQRDFFLFI